MPLVSVVIPTFGRPKLLQRAIDSVLRQTISDFEIIVVVDGHDPDTIMALTEVAQSDKRVRFLQNSEKIGAGLSRDRGVDASGADWIAFLDDDDEWLPSKLEKQLATLMDNPRLISTTFSKVVTPNGTFISPTRTYDGSVSLDEWLFNRETWLKGYQGMLQTSSLMVHRSIFETLQFGRSRHEEWEFAIRATKQFGFALKVVPEPLVIYYAYYAGRSYRWESSVEWIRSMSDVVSPKAHTGFCLNVATQGLEGQDRNRAFRVLLGTALEHGSPTLKQLLAFGLMWLIPTGLRQRIRSSLRLSRRRSIPLSASPAE